MKDDRASPCTGASKTGTRAIYTRRATPSTVGGRCSWSATGLRRRMLTTDACVWFDLLCRLHGTRPGRACASIEFQRFNLLGNFQPGLFLLALPVTQFRLFNSAFFNFIFLFISLNRLI